MQYWLFAFVENAPMALEFSANAHGHYCKLHSLRTLPRRFRSPGTECAISAFRVRGERMHHDVPSELKTQYLKCAFIENAPAEPPFSRNGMSNISYLRSWRTHVLCERSQRTQKHSNGGVRSLRTLPWSLRSPGTEYAILAICVRGERMHCLSVPNERKT